MQNVESRLCAVLRKKQVPAVDLQQAIAVAKVKCIEESISLCHALKQEVGSFALMAGTGFEQLDFLQCCKFAEGDSRILMQKMARDLMQSGGNTIQEKQALKKLQGELQVAIKAGNTKHKAWDICWESVYALAEAHMQGVMEQLSRAKL